MISKRVNIDFKQYKTLYILENRDYWYSIKNKFDKEFDLVLTIDLAVKKEVEAIGGTANYIDHLTDNKFLNHLNHQTQYFIDNWFIIDGKDAFQYRNINFGNSFKLNILNDVTYTIHFFANILFLKELNVKRIICGIDDITIKQCLNELNIDIEYISQRPENILPKYYFPIGKWMKSAIEKRSLRRQVLNILIPIIEYVKSLNKYFRKSKQIFIYINIYNPTFDIVKRLRSEKKVNLVLSTYTGIKSLIFDNRINFQKIETHKFHSHYNNIFSSIKRISFIIGSIDLGPKLFKIIEPIVLSNILNCLGSIDTIISFFENKDLRLMVPVTDLWMENRLLMNYCIYKKIPIYMIINGLLHPGGYKDGFDSTWVNAYGTVIKEDYYLNAQNILILGDPRMDFYAKSENKHINYSEPTIVIGTSNYNPIDLNSYLAIEYEFMFDILSILEDLEKIKNFNILVKVRANGYLERYKEFVNEYFGKMKIKLIQDIPFTEVIKNADLYISIYSQTHFEAACLGIPSIYYKNDTEILTRPFDGKSELVTASNKDELKEKILQFFCNDDCYRIFMEKEVLEKYIGPLEGKSCERNVEFIYSLIQ